MSDLLNKASLVVIPSGYKEDTVYSVVPSDGSGDLSFTRASNGTRINSAGLVEVCPWNLVQNSENFDAVWTKYNGATVTTDATTAPNGTSTADLLIAGSSQEIYSANMPKPAEELFYTFSCYAKIYNTNVFGLVCSDFATSGSAATFNLSTLAITTSTGATWSNTSASIESVGNGWYRCILTSKSPNTTGLYLSLYTSGTNSVSGVYIWGAQLNIGSTAKPYFPTTDRLNVPRLTYQNGGGGCPSLLLEKQSTNYCLYSEQFDDASWLKVDNGSASTPVVTANYTTSPDGTQNADRVQFSRTGTTDIDYSLVTSNLCNLNLTGTATIYAKSLTSSTQNLLLYWGNGEGSVFQVTTQWTRITLNNLSAATQRILFGTRGGTGNYYNGGDLSLDVAVWGAQVEESSYPTSYIPTTSSSATRVADLAVKSSISSLFGASATSLFMDFEITQVSNGGNWTVTGYDGSNLFSLCQFDNASNFPRIVFDGGVDTTLGTALSIGRHKIAVSFATNDFRAYIDGVLVHTDTSCTYNRYDRIAVNGTAWTGNTYNTNSFKLNEYAQFSNVLTNAELQALTTL